MKKLILAINKTISAINKFVENHKMGIACIAAIILFVVLLFLDTKEGYLPVITYVGSIIIIVLLAVIDHWRRPEVYRKKPKVIQKKLFE